MQKLFIVTGEASGDHHGALVAQELHKILPGLELAGVGGDELARAGMRPVYHSRNLAVVGLIEVLSRAPHILAAYRRIRREFRDAPPDLLILCLDSG